MATGREPGVRYSWRDVTPPDSSASQAPIRNESGPRTRHRLLNGLCNGTAHLRTGVKMMILKSHPPRRPNEPTENGRPGPRHNTSTICRCALVAVSMAAAALTSTGCAASGSAAPSPPHRAPAPAKAGADLQIVSVRYGRFRPSGAPRPYTALQIRARDADGQIVSERYMQLGPSGGAAIADGGCGLGGRRSGQLSAFAIPMRLRPGTYSFQVRVDASTCRRPDHFESATGTFTVRAR